MPICARICAAILTVTESISALPPCSDFQKRLQVVKKDEKAVSANFITLRAKKIPLMQA
jgi:hypothetical protein